MSMRRTTTRNDSRNRRNTSRNNRSDRYDLLTVRKRGELPVGTATSATHSKHRAWLIVGIVLAAVLVLGIGYLAGKGGVKIKTVGKAVETAITCVKVTDLPIAVGATTSQKNTLTTARQDVCQSQTGCQFRFNNAALTTDDTCSGETLVCPDVSKFPGATVPANSGRKKACERTGCIFTNGGDNGPTGDMCTAPAVETINLCGNGVIDPGEGCDGTNFGSNSCASVKGTGWTGSLTCAADCKSYSVTQCHVCGNSQIEGVEACDGLNFGAASCAYKGAGYTGIPTCATDCLSYSLDSCMKCGDGEKTGVEVCDGTEVGTATCASVKGQGWTGPVICNAGCSGYDTQYCNAQCVNSFNYDLTYANVCLNDDVGLTGPANINLRASCSEAVKCEYTCKQGYVKSGNSCVSPESDCADNNDNDMDTLFDCDDPDCASNAACLAPECSAASPSACTTQTDCNNIGKWMYSGGCVLDCEDPLVDDNGVCRLKDGTGCSSNDDCVSRNCGGGTCQAAAPATPGDVSGDTTVNSDDVTVLLYVLLAGEQTACGGSGQPTCDYSGDGLWACDSGQVYFENPPATCTESGLAGDLTGDGVVNSDDVTVLLYVLLAGEQTDCGGSGQPTCDYSGDGLWVCDSGKAYFDAASVC